MEYLFSVIVPIYNCESYLSRAVESVIAQKSFDKVQLILVDDGSSDSSGKLCDSYAEKYVNIIAVHQPNSGVSVARNRGIEASQGKWIAFLDSDDYLLDGFFEEILSEGDADLICCDYVVSAGSKSGLERKFEKRYFKSDEFSEYLYPAMLDYSLMYNCWNKIFKTEIVRANSVSFESGIAFGEDMRFVYEYIRHIENFRFIDKVLYYYYVNEGSVTVGLKNSFEIHRMNHDWICDYFDSIDCGSLPYKKILDGNFAYNSTSAISGVGFNCGFFEGIAQIRKIVKDTQFISVYKNAGFVEFKTIYDKFLHYFIRHKMPFMLMLLIKLCKLKTSLVARSERGDNK